MQRPYTAEMVRFGQHSRPGHSHAAWRWNFAQVLMVFGQHTAFDCEKETWICEKNIKARVEQRMIHAWNDQFTMLHDHTSNCKMGAVCMKHAIFILQLFKVHASGFVAVLTETYDKWHEEIEFLEETIKKQTVPIKMNIIHELAPIAPRTIRATASLVWTLRDPACQHKLPIISMLTWRRERLKMWSQRRDLTDGSLP